MGANFSCVNCRAHDSDSVDNLHIVVRMILTVWTIYT